MSSRTLRTFGAAFLAVSLFLTVGCASIPTAPETPDDFASAPSELGPLAELSERVAREQGVRQSGFRLIAHNEQGLIDRLAVVDLATTSIDAQYFIWQGDATGRLLFDRLIRAADRGVKVRLLVDDMGVTAKRKTMATITAHPNIEVRVYNPFASWTSYLFNFKELNRRMHNKVLIVDNRVAIVGGRNIGDEYFGLSKKYNFRDLDVLVVGTVVPEISDAFDEYWNDDTAYPAMGFSSDISSEDQATYRKALQLELARARPILRSYPIEPQDWQGWLQELATDLDYGVAHFLQDDPVDIDGESMRLADMLEYIAAPVEKEFLIVSPYLIPVGTFLEDLKGVVDEGIRVRILTGSMGSNNHTAAHSHYKKYRKRILDAGADLIEFRHDQNEAMRSFSDVPPVEAKFISLHTKTIVVDRKNCFIGSLNLDPRALEINTENGLYIESPELAAELARQIDQMMAPENAWQVLRDDNGKLYWESATGTVTKQPARSGGQRVSDFFFRLLPIEKQL